jgi:chaperonin GroEL (HSP60 family)
MEKLEKATGGNVVNAVELISKTDLGYAGLVEERKISGSKMLFIEQCKNPHAVSIIVRGGTEQVVDEVDRSLNDTLRVVGCIIEDGKAIAGGGRTGAISGGEIRRGDGDNTTYISGKFRARSDR